MTAFGYFAVLFATAFLFYTYVGYPLLLFVLSLLPSRRRPGSAPSEEWPEVSITVPMYNEEDQAADLLESLLALDYPAEKRQILVVSDASTDGTDAIVEGYATEGVELLRQSRRGGKTAAENAAVEHLRGSIVVNTDASTRIRPEALKRLVAAFSDPEVGLASGRDVSVSGADADLNVGEAGYVGYEMWIRDLETRATGIVGASGCCYAIRSELHRIPTPDPLSRDFAAALKCREHGYRAVSVSDAVCLVPRTSSLRKEFRRKVRTITRGVETLYEKRALLNPFRHGLFAWKLISHKVCRWALPWVVGMGLIGLAVLAPDRSWAAALVLFSVVGIVLGTVGWALGDGRRLPVLLKLPGFVLMGNVAAMHAVVRAISGDKDPIWEPTRREAVQVAGE